jgi:hypothetical protein
MMRQTKSLHEILNITDCNELISGFYSYLVEKKNSNQKLNDVEDVVYLLVSMLLDIEMEGFVDLFHQLYSLQDCIVVEQNLRRFRLHKLANLFNEAKLIYINGNLDITQEEYKEISPVIPDEIQSRRFEEISDLVLAEDSEIYKIGDCVCDFVKSNRIVLLEAYDS